MTINIGIIGFGLSGSVFHAPAISFLKEFNLTGIVTTNIERKKEIKKKYNNVSIFDSVEDLINNDKIDCIIISVPNMYHYEYAKKALLKNKNVVIEKPFTPTVKEADELIKLAKDKNLVLTIYHNRRFDSDFLTIKKLLKSEKLGDLKTYEAHFDRFRPNINKKWKEIPNPGTGSLYDLGSHLIDQALILFGMPNSIYADIRIERKAAITTDAFDITLFYKNLRVFLRSSSLTKELGPHFILNGNKGSFIKYGLDVQEEQLKEIDPFANENYGKEPINLHGLLNTIEESSKIKSEIGDYRKFYINLSNAINNNENLIVSPSEARNVIYIIEKAKKSSKLKKVIEV